MTTDRQIKSLAMDAVKEATYRETVGRKAKMAKTTQNGQNSSKWPR